MQPSLRWCRKQTMSNVYSMFPVGANLRLRADSLNKILISTVQSETLQVLKHYEERISVYSLHHRSAGWNCGFWQRISVINNWLTYMFTLILWVLHKLVYNAIGYVILTSVLEWVCRISMDGTSIFFNKNSCRILSLSVSMCVLKD